MRNFVSIFGMGNPVTKCPETSHRQHHENELVFL